MIEKYGGEAQVNQCIQELAETIVAFTKIKQHGYTAEIQSNIFKEVTQSFVTLFQIVELYEIPIQALLESEELAIIKKHVPELLEGG